jgi:DNA-binding CsgD family transcriptional regulator
VDSTLAQIRRPRLVSTSTHLSRREKEVHDLLMENLSNKEIAARLAMSERTVKFHVSNLLSKHRVKRRADLILLSFSESRPA